MARTDDAASARAVDKALLDAFRLGAGSESHADIVRAFRELDAVRRRIGKVLTRRG